MRRTRVAILLVLAIACGREPKSTPPTPQPPSPIPKPLEAPPPAPSAAPPVDRDLPAIQQEGTLRVLFTFNSTGYFIIRGETMGYEFELLERFAHDAKLKLHPVVIRDSRTLVQRLNAGEGDVVAAQLVSTPNQSEVRMTDSLYATKPVLVQRGGENPAAGQPPAVTTAIEREERESEPRPIEIRARLISTPAELAGQRVHISRSSPYRQQLLELSDELTQDIEVVEVDETTDKLIQRLSEGQIGYTVAAENLAALKKDEYTNLIIKPAIGPPQQIAWAVRTNAPQLQDALNRWIAAQKKRGLLAVLYRKYFLDRRGFEERAASRYLTAETGRLSPYDDWFREYARIPGWDWRLVASQSYQESRFNPGAHSWAGAVGLMQMMPRTARELRIDARDPRQSIEGACRYVWKLDDRWKEAIPKEEERRKFILAAYNVGTGHVDDARRLAEKYGDDPGRWSDVAYWLIRKSKRSVYNDPVVKYGYARGTEPVAYVELILDRFEHYKQFVTAEPPAPAPPAN